MSSRQRPSFAVKIAPASAIRKVVNMPSPEQRGGSRKKGSMNRFTFTLKEFWERCMDTVYDADTGELIDNKKMLENKDREVLSFWMRFDGGYGGISVKLENEDMEDNE